MKRFDAQRWQFCSPLANSSEPVEPKRDDNADPRTVGLLDTTLGETVSQKLELRLELRRDVEPILWRFILDYLSIFDTLALALNQEIFL